MKIIRHFFVKVVTITFNNYFTNLDNLATSLFFFFTKILPFIL